MALGDNLPYALVRLRSSGRDTIKLQEEPDKATEIIEMVNKTVD